RDAVLSPWMSRTPMHSGAPPADPASPSGLGTEDRQPTAQHDFVAMDRQPSGKSTADGPRFLRGFLGACSEFWVGMRGMRGQALVLIGVSGLLHAGSAAEDHSTMRAAARSALYMRVFGQAVPPSGYLQYCAATPDHCVPGPRRDRRFHATPERLSE